MIDFSDELYTIAKEAADTFETIVYDKNGNERHVPLAPDDYGIIVKPARNVRSYDYRNIIVKKMQKIKEAYNNPIINMQTLKESGRIEMINKLVASGMTVEAAMEDKRVINTYGVIRNLTRSA